ncbi:hypothetical protein BROUX41_000635 [Berkeleyomyces rouxiae]|uniref:uncharacterized protein n=1 Tax=Berkeleyomyces rouxiae TaxID=2035830 RepID=UPI003B7BF49C
MGIPCLRLLRLPSRLRRRARRNRMSTLLILLTLCTLLIVPPYVIYKPPPLLIRHFAQRWPNVLFEVPTTKKLIALTIDDAPSPYTRDIAAILAANNAHATFFVIGSQVADDAGGTRAAMSLRELVRAGHELGNHAMHDEPSRALPDAMLVDQVEQVHAKIRAAYDAEARPLPPVNLFRPGSGFFSERMLKVLGAINHRVVLGGIYPHDPQIPHAWLNARHILSLARPGAIIICHDRRPWTLPMLATVLPELRRRGYEIVTVTRLLEEAGSS